MYDRAVRRGIDGVYLVEPDEIYEIEPNINTAVKKGLYSQNVAIVAPYDLAIAYAEVASDNGVNFRLEEEVLTIQNITKGFKVVTNKNKFSCKVVINTIADEIYINATRLFKEFWKGQPLRLIGVALTGLTDGTYEQMSLFEDTENKEGCHAERGQEVPDWRQRDPAAGPQRRRGGSGRGRGGRQPHLRRRHQGGEHLLRRRKGRHLQRPHRHRGRYRRRLLPLSDRQ